LLLSGRKGKNMQRIDSRNFNNKCPGCGSSNLKENGGGYYSSPTGKRGTRTIYLCKDCGCEFEVVQVNSHPIPGPTPRMD